MDLSLSAMLQDADGPGHYIARKKKPSNPKQEQLQRYNRLKLREERKQEKSDVEKSI